MKEQFIKTKMCPHMVKGHCNSGEKCLFAHSESELRPLPDLRKTKLCDSVTKGGRCYNRKCSYAHSREDLRANADLVAYKASLCFFYIRGRCLNGEKCRFAHGREELRNTDVQNEHRRLSTDGDVNCVLPKYNNGNEQNYVIDRCGVAMNNYVPSKHDALLKKVLLYSNVGDSPINNSETTVSNGDTIGSISDGPKSVISDSISYTTEIEISTPSKAVDGNSEKCFSAETDRTKSEGFSLTNDILDKSHRTASMIGNLPAYRDESTSMQLKNKVLSAFPKCDKNTDIIKRCIDYREENLDINGNLIVTAAEHQALICKSRDGIQQHYNSYPYLKQHTFDNSSSYTGYHQMDSNLTITDFVNVQPYAMLSSIVDCSLIANPDCNLQYFCYDGQQQIEDSIGSFGVMPAYISLCDINLYTLTLTSEGSPELIYKLG